MVIRGLGSFLSTTVSVVVGLALTFVADLLLHPHDVDDLQQTQRRYMSTLEAFTPPDFASRFIAAMAEDPAVEAARDRRKLEEIGRNITAANEQAFGTKEAGVGGNRSNGAPIEWRRNWKPGIQHWASYAHGVAAVFRPPIALVDVLWNTFPGFLSAGFVLTAAELVIAGFLVMLYVRPRIPNIWPPLTWAVIVLMTVAAGTLVAEIGWLAAHAGLYLLGGILGLAASISTWIAMGGLAGIIAVKYAEAAAHHKAHALAAKALHLD